MNASLLIKTTQNILNALGKTDSEVSLLIVDDDYMAALNQQYRGREGPTNVLAFPMGEGEFSHISPQLIGDVVISVETAERERVSSEISLENRIKELLVHGILHLVGYDHERSDEEDRQMRAKEASILDKIE